MHFLCFLAVFELMLDSLTTIYVEPHQCPSHQSILLTQGPIHEILADIAQLLVVVEKLSFFESAILNFFLLHSHKNQSKFIGQQGRAKILMITLISRKFVVCLYFCNTVYYMNNKFVVEIANENITGGSKSYYSPNSNETL